MYEAAVRQSPTVAGLTARTGCVPVAVRSVVPAPFFPLGAAVGQRRVNPGRVRVVVADDHEFVRAGLESMLRRYRPQWEIAGQASDGRQAVELAEALQPDLLILDLVLPEISGLSVMERLAQTSPGTRVMILTTHPRPQLIRTCRRLGARAYVSKNELVADLVVAMDRILAGEPFFASERFTGEESIPVESRAYVPCQYLLTSRELDVMRHLAAGRTNKQTAVELGMSVRTAESHRASIFHKLGVSSLGQLVRMAVRDGQI